MSTTEEPKKANSPPTGDVEDQGDDEFLSRKALQTYMHTTKVLQEQEEKSNGGSDKKKDNDTNNDLKRSENNDLNGKETDQDFENILRLDTADGEHGQDVDAETEGDERLLNKLVSETNRKVAERVEGEAGEDEDGDVDDDLVTTTSNGLLESLTTDIEKYHKKVQLKKKFENSALSMERKIVQDLNKSQENEAEESSKKRPRENNDDTDSSESLKKTKTPTDAVLSEPLSENSATSRKPSTWTKAEDDAIVYYKEEMKYSWKKIEELLENKHSWQAIQMRYLRNHKSRNDEWSRYMELKLINAIRKDWENRWKRIAVDLGKDFSTERCITKNVEICKKMELPYYNTVFKNKEITQGYKNQFNDIKDADAHKKLMLVYMGLDSITYEEDPESQIDGLHSNELSKVKKNDTTAAKPPTTADSTRDSNINMNIMDMNMNMNIDDVNVNVNEIDSENVDPAIADASGSKEASTTETTTTI